MKQQNIVEKILELENKEIFPSDSELDKYALEIAEALTVSPPESYNDIGFDKLWGYKPTTALVIVKVSSLLYTLMCNKSKGIEENPEKGIFENNNSLVDSYNSQLLISTHALFENEYITEGTTKVILGYSEYHI